MATKKKTKKAVANSFATIEVIRVDDVDRLGLLLTHANIRAIRAEYTLQRQKLDAFLKEMDKDGIVTRANSALDGLRRASEEADQKYQAIVASIEEKLGVRLSEYTMQQETGELVPLDRPMEKADSK